MRGNKSLVKVARKTVDATDWETRPSFLLFCSSFSLSIFLLSSYPLVLFVVCGVESTYATEGFIYYVRGKFRLWRAAIFTKSRTRDKLRRTIGLKLWNRTREFDIAMEDRISFGWLNEWCIFPIDLSFVECSMYFWLLFNCRLGFLRAKDRSVPLFLYINLKISEARRGYCRKK